jgi:GH18 family chitinase
MFLSFINESSAIFPHHANRDDFIPQYVTPEEVIFMSIGGWKKTVDFQK